MTPRPLVFSGLLALTLGACLGRTSTAPILDSRAGHELSARLGCGGCHEGAPFTPATRLAGLAGRRPPAALAAALARHEPELGSDVAGDLLQFLTAGARPFEAREERLEAGAIERGRQLYHGVGCVACHAPFEPADSLERPLWDYPEVFEASAAAPDAAPVELSLRRVSQRFSRASLADYLRDPLAVHPDGRMPDLALEADEAADLATYLWYEDGVERGARLTRQPGLVLEYFEGNFPGELVDFEALEPLRHEVTTRFHEGLEHADDGYAFRFRGFLEVPETGTYTFSTRSDDGSMLYVDGATVVDNRGQHSMTRVTGQVALEAGAHALEVTYFENLGDDGLFVRWEGPGFAERDLGPEGLQHFAVVVAAPEATADAVDPDRARRGAARFAALGCAGCHGGGAPGPAFATLRPDHGCLAGAPGDGHPSYDLSRGERRALEQAIVAGPAPAAAPSEALAAELERLRCGACHARDELLSGPDPQRRAYFRTVGDLDLGDEGRLPPHLEGVGAKLKPAWLRQVLVDGTRVRPYMRTRMPRFGAASVEPIAAWLAKVDAPLRDEREPEFTPAAVEAGRLLAGTKGLGCIQCHDFAGHPSIGIPAVDLAHVHERLYPGWFRRLLMDPIALKMNTRMPTFWEGGQSPVDVLGRDPARQVDALWSYLSLGTSMPLPEGLVPLPNEYEVEVTDRPVTVGVFLKDVSPRTVCVGYPERLNIAYDVQNCRLAMAWRGRFLDARGTWFGRAGQLEEPAGEAVIVFPRGPGVQGSVADPVVLGRRIDAEGRPVFRYSVGRTVVEETITPVLRAGGAGFVRRFTFPVREAILNSRPLHLSLIVGSNRRDGAGFVFEGGGAYRVSILSGARFQAYASSHGPGGVFAEVDPDTEDVEVEYSW